MNNGAGIGEYVEYCPAQHYVLNHVDNEQFYQTFSWPRLIWESADLLLCAPTPLLSFGILTKWPNHLSLAVGYTEMK